MCEMTDVLDHPDRWECVTCGHEWTREAQAAGALVIKDAYGTVLADGDSVTLIKDLKLKGSSQVIAGHQRRFEGEKHSLGGRRPRNRL